MFDAEQRFRFDAATRDELQSLHREMQSAYARHRKERLDPVCERYMRVVASRTGRRGSGPESPPVPRSTFPSAHFLEVQAKIANYQERHRWPFVFAYHRRAYREYGLAGLLWLMQSLHRAVRPRKLSAVTLLMMTRLHDPTPGEIMRWIRQLHGEGLPIAPTTKKPGRRSLGPTAMTPAERQRRHRARKRQTSGTQSQPASDP